MGLFSRKSEPPLLLPKDYATSLLDAKGVPRTEENLAATNERISWMFLIQGRHFMSQVDPARVEAFGHAFTDYDRWQSSDGPQWVLDGITDWMPQARTAAEGLLPKVHAALLEGEYFDGGPDKPLSRVADWFEE